MPITSHELLRSRPPTHTFVRYVDIWGKRYAWCRRVADRVLVLAPSPKTWWDDVVSPSEIDKMYREAR